MTHRLLTLVRALVYTTLFVSFVLVYLPAAVLRWSGVRAPPELGAAPVVGMVVVALGAVLALWSVITLATVGRGTPAPFDPPRKLVVRGPYRRMRNPMYVGAIVALGGAALYFESLPLLGFAGCFGLAAHALVCLYEEPALRRTFGADYEAYLRSVRRWLPVS